MTNSSLNRDSSVMMSADDAVGEILLLGIGVQVDEGQNGDRRLVRDRERGFLNALNSFRSAASSSMR